MRSNTPPLRANHSLHGNGKKPPRFFEKVVIDLLITMGYGGSRKEAGKAN